MYKFFIISVLNILVLVNNTLWAQNLTNMIVSDIQTHQGIPFAAVKIVNKSQGTFTNEKGQFQLSRNINDSICISHIGYRSKTILSKVDTIFLEPLCYTLPEIEVNLKREKSSKIGLFDAREITWNYVGISMEAVLKINIPDYYLSYKIRALKLKCRNQKFMPLIRLHIYNADGNGFPDNELLTKDVIVNYNIKKNNIIDLSNLNLFLKERILFIGIEWLFLKEKNIIDQNSNNSSRNNELSVGVTHSCSQSLTYIRSIYLTEYKWVLDHPIFKQQNDRNYPGNLMISAIIE